MHRATLRHFALLAARWPSARVALGFNLDESFPTARSATLPTSYFLGHIISLRPGEIQTLIVGAETKKQYCQFIFHLIIDTDHGQVIEAVTDHGKPFSVTAAAKVVSYKVIYAGGVASPTRNDAFGPISAKTLAQLTGLP